MKNKALGTSVLSPCQIVAWNLKRIRRTRGLTQEQAAKKLEPYLGYRLSRAAFSQAERYLHGKIRRFDADEIVAFARAFEVPIPFFFCPAEPHFRGKTVMVNGRSGNPKARVTSPPLTRQQMLTLAQGLPAAPTLERMNILVAERQSRAISEGIFRFLREHPEEVARVLVGKIPAAFWEHLLADMESKRTAISEQRAAQEIMEELLKSDGEHQ
jgi:transcriptional regulator with XRE-family HTH domain